MRRTLPLLCAALVALSLSGCSLWKLVKEKAPRFVEDVIDSVKGMADDAEKFIDVPRDAPKAGPDTPVAPAPPAPPGAESSLLPIPIPGGAVSWDGEGVALIASSTF